MAALFNGILGEGGAPEIGLDYPLADPSNE
jgi:hypothetical protein